MSVESKLLKRALKGEIKDLIEQGFDPSVINEPYRSALKMLADFFMRTGDVLTKGRLVRDCEGLELQHIADKAAKKATYYWYIIKTERVEDRLFKTMAKVTQIYNDRKGDPRKILSDITQHIVSLNSSVGGLDVSAPSNAAVARQLEQDFILARDGKMPGIPFPAEFTLLIEAIGRLKPAQITTISARTEVGKTWLALIIALNAAVSGHRVVIASMEMAIVDIVRRLAALFGKLNFDRVIKGTLQGKNKKLYMNILKGYARTQGFWANLKFVDPAEITSVEAVEVKAANCDAHLVVADAFYDWPHNQTKDHEGIKANLRVVRRVSLITRRHWLLTSQLNRKADKIYSSDEFAMGGSDAFNYLSNYVIMLMQTKKHKKNRQVIMRLNKKRDAAYSPPRVHNWDFKRMDISQIGIYNEDRSILAGGDI